LSLNICFCNQGDIDWLNLSAATNEYKMSLSDDVSEYIFGLASFVDGASGQDSAGIKWADCLYNLAGSTLYLIALYHPL
jgi:hypothetical protein